MWPESITGTITIYHVVPCGRDPDTIETISVGGVFWDDVSKREITKNGLEKDAKAVVYIPASAGITPECGDILVRGIGDSAESVSEIQEMYPNAVTIAEVADRRYGGVNMRHWEVCGI